MAIDLDLPDDPQAALSALREASASGPVLVFKKSPICPVSAMAEGELSRWLGSRDVEDGLRVAMVDVIARRPLARGLTAALEIQHESPQALLFRDGELAWHESHGGLTEDAFTAALG